MLRWAPAAMVVLVACEGRGPLDVRGAHVFGPGAAAADAAPVDDRLLPLEVGRRWTFQVTPLDPAAPAKCANPEASVTGTAMLGAEGGWTYAPTCISGSYDVFIDGDDIASYPGHAHIASELFQYASAPVEEGHTWTTGTLTYVWHDAGTVEVPAGRFEHCWQRTPQNSADGYIILCRGVGLTVSQSVTTNYHLELAAKNF